MAHELDNWEMYFYRLDDSEKVIVGFDVNAAEEPQHEGGATGRRLVIYFDPRYVRPNGLPEKPELERVGRLEERLLEILRDLEVDGRFVGRLTYIGRRELVFQLDDSYGLAGAVEQLRQEEPDLEAKILDGEGWTFFDEFVRPKPEHWVQIYDRRVIDELINAGTDPRRLHLLEYTFRGMPPLLLSVVRVLEKHDFRVEAYRADTIIVREPARLDLDRIWAISSEFKRLAESRGVTFEGWGAALQPPPEPPVSDDLLLYGEDGTPSFFLCPHCRSPIQGEAQRCQACRREITGEKELVTIDEYAEASRTKCPFCRKIMLAHASVCPHCAKAMRAEVSG